MFQALSNISLSLRALCLKTLEGAVRDGDPIRGVITGSAAGNVGHKGSDATSSAVAQEELIKQAYRNAGIADIARTGFVECHGVG